MIPIVSPSLIEFNQIVKFAFNIVIGSATEIRTSPRANSTALSSISRLLTPRTDFKN
jgi:hypothetical protein